MAENPRRVQLKVRLDDDAHMRLAVAADENGRTLVAEIRHRLEQSFQADWLRSVIREELRSK